MTNPPKQKLGAGWTTHLNNVRSRQIGSFPQAGVNIQTYLKPPPRKQ